MAAAHVKHVLQRIEGSETKDPNSKQVAEEQGGTQQMVRHK